MLRICAANLCDVAREQRQKYDFVLPQSLKIGRQSSNIFSRASNDVIDGRCGLPSLWYRAAFTGPTLKDVFVSLIVVARFSPCPLW
jgi:hypothetical protein